MRPHAGGVDLVSAIDVGTVALDRMLRDRVVAPLAPGFAAPVDLPVTPTDRVTCFARAVPAHTVVSGLAGLWVAAGGYRPSSLDLVGAPGLHRPPPGTGLDGWLLVFHSGPAAREPSQTIVGVRVALPHRCAADALRWDGLEEALPAVVNAALSRVVDPLLVQRIVDATDARGFAAGRMKSAWEAVAVALDFDRGRAAAKSVASSSHP